MAEVTGPVGGDAAKWTSHTPAFGDEDVVRKADAYVAAAAAQGGGGVTNPRLTRLNTLVADKEPPLSDVLKSKLIESGVISIENGQDQIEISTSKLIEANMKGTFTSSERDDVSDFAKNNKGLFTPESQTIIDNYLS